MNHANSHPVSRHTLKRSPWEAQIKPLLGWNLVLKLPPVILAKARIQNRRGRSAPPPSACLGSRLRGNDG